MKHKIRHREAEASGFQLYDFEYPPHLNIPAHEHQEAQLNFVLEGSLTEGCDETVLHTQRYDLSFKPARARHWVASGPDGARVLVDCTR